MPPIPAERRTALTRRFQHVMNTLGDSTAARLRPAWLALGEYNEAQIPTFTRKATPVLNAAKSVAVKHAAAYYALHAGVTPVGVSVASITVEADLREPFISVWQAFQSGASFEAAVNAGEGRLDAVSRDLLVSSGRQTGDEVVQRAGLRIVGWERVPDDGACPWCEEVAPGFYTSAESADFGHDRCGCSAEPIYA